MSDPDIIGTPDIRWRPEQITLRKGSVIRTAGDARGENTWPVSPAFVVPEDGLYRVVIDPSGMTATIERVSAPNLFTAFADDDLDALDSILTGYLGDYDSSTWHPEAARLRAEIEGEMARRRKTGAT